MEGECLCKAVKVRVNDDELFSGKRRGHICHCANCRKVAGGICKAPVPQSDSRLETLANCHLYCRLVGANLLIEEAKVEFPNGKDGLKVYADPDTLSGTPLNRCFCGTCGCPIFSQTPLYKDMIILKLGIYSDVPEPEWESFVKDKQSWEKPFDGTVQYKGKSKGEKMPDSI